LRFLVNSETLPNKKADLRRLFYWLKLNYLAAGAVSVVVVVVVTAEAASAGTTTAAGAAAGTSTTGAGAGLSQAAKVTAKRAAIRAERIILNPLGEVAKNVQESIRHSSYYFERPGILTLNSKKSSAKCTFL